MEKKITLQSIADLITEKFSSLDAKINGVDNKLTGKIDALDQKFTRRISALDEKFTRKFDVVDQKLNRIELNISDIQKDTESIHDELKGIHKVLDKFNGRITRLEIHTGIPAEAAPVEIAEE